MSTTVYGAIGNCLRQPVFKLGSTTNQEEFQTFVKDVKGAVVTGQCDKKPVLLYDGALAHLTRQSQRVLKEHFTPL